VRRNAKNTRFSLTVTQKQAAAAQRFRRFRQTKAEARALRTAIEATVFQLTHSMPNDKVPVRGLFRVTNVVLCSTLALNLRRIDRYQKGKQRGKFTKKMCQTGESAGFSHFFSTLCQSFGRLVTRLYPASLC
jgi:hypothetical protein